MKFLYTPVLLLVSAICFAQKPVSVTYFKEGFRIVKTLDSADFIRVVLPPDSGSKFYKLRDYYAASKKIKFEGAIVRPNYTNGYEGKCVLFYPDGNVKLRAYYHSGSIFGKAYAYYPDGKLSTVKDYHPAPSGQPITVPLVITCIDSTGTPIVNNGNGYYKGNDTAAGFDEAGLYEEGHIADGLRDGTWHGSTNPVRLTYTTPAAATPKVQFTEKYESGMLVSGEAKDLSGVTYPYTQRMQNFDFNGGMQKFAVYLRQNVVYPADARRGNIEGRVLVQFTINADGSIGNAKVPRGVTASLNDEAIRVIKQSSGRWVCEQIFGVPVSASVVIPITFSLK